MIAGIILIDRILFLPNTSLLLLDYRKLGQNAIHIEMLFEGMALYICGSVIYDFLLC